MKTFTVYTVYIYLEQKINLESMKMYAKVMNIAI